MVSTAENHAEIDKPSVKAITVQLLISWFGHPPRGSSGRNPAFFERNLGLTIFRKLGFQVRDFALDPSSVSPLGTLAVTSKVGRVTLAHVSQWLHVRALREESGRAGEFLLFRLDLSLEAIAFVLDCPLKDPESLINRFHAVSPELSVKG
jgi:hypothetical protein